MKPSFSAKGPGLKGLEEKMKKLAGLEVRVGVFGDAKFNGSELTNAELAAIHEFGAPRANIPERAHIRGTFDAKQAEWQALTAKLLKGVLADRFTPEQALGILGEKAVADMRAFVRAGVEPPLKPATIRRKGSSTPLIDTGRYVQSFGWSLSGKR